MSKSKNSDAPAARTCPTCNGGGCGVPITVERTPGKFVDLPRKCPRCLGTRQVPA